MATLFSRQVTIAIRRAGVAAASTKSGTVEPKHLALALMQPGTTVSSVLGKMGVEVPAVVREIADIVFEGNQYDLLTVWQAEIPQRIVPFNQISQDEWAAAISEPIKHTQPVTVLSDSVKRTIDLSIRIAKMSNSSKVNTTHVFCGLIDSIQPGELASIFASMHISALEYRRVMDEKTGHAEE